MIRKFVLTAAILFAGTLFTSVPVMAGTIQMWTTSELILPADGQNEIIHSGNVSLSAGSGIRTLSFQSDGCGLSIAPIDGVVLAAGELLLSPLSEGSVFIGGSSLPPTEPSESPQYDYSVFIDGDLFLDYSVFSSGEDLNITGDILISGETVTIYSPDDIPLLPPFSTTVLQVFGDDVNGIGSYLLFSESPVLSGLFEATGSVYIGDYSVIEPAAAVPLPASIYFLLPGLVAVIGKRKTSKHGK